MSRSYKKHPVIKDTSGSSYRKFAKNYSNRIIRKTEDVANGKSYRKIYETYNINDWIFHWDPNPVYYFDRNGVMGKIEPTPKWKARMK
jgi:hypothetical protein